MSNESKTAIQSPAGSEHSRTFKVKKFLASKTASTSVGRKAIGYFLGEDGVQLMSTLKKAATKHKGAAFAKDLKKNIFKIAVKCKLLHDGGFIVQKDVFHLAQPFNHVCLNIHDMLKLACSETERPKDPIDASGLNGNCMHLKELVLIVLKPHLQAKNYGYLNEIFDYIGSVAFLNLVLNSQDYAVERKSMNEKITNLLHPILLERDYDQVRCKYAFCWRPCVQAHQNFAASAWCAKHHYKNYQNLVAQPSSHYFLHDEGGKYQPFIDVLTKELPANNLEFYHATYNYASAKNSIRKVFAAAIFEKFLDTRTKTKAAGIDDAIIKEIASKLNVSEPQLYDQAQKLVLQKINKIFVDKFLPSDSYKAYITSLALPQYLLDDLEYRKKNKDVVKKMEQAQRQKDLETRMKIAEATKEEKREEKEYKSK